MASDQFPPSPDDPNNPYAAPRSEVGPEPMAFGLGDLRPAHPDLGDIFNRTWAIYKDQMWNCIGAIFICGALNVAASVVQNVVQAMAGMGQAQPGGQPGAPGAVQVLVFLVVLLASIVFQVWVNAGLFLFLLNIGRGLPAEFSLIFAGGPYLLRMIVAGILFSLILLGIIILCMIPGGIALAALGTQSTAGIITLIVFVVLAIVASVVISIRLSLYSYLILDRDVGIMDSIRLSIEYTKGNALLIFLIMLLAIPINVLGFVACIIGLIFTYPFTLLLLIVTYLAITGQSAGGMKGEPLAELEPI